MTKNASDKPKAVSLYEWSDIEKSEEVTRSRDGLRLEVTKLIDGEYRTTTRRITERQAVDWALKRLMSPELARMVRAAA